MHNVMLDINCILEVNVEYGVELNPHLCTGRDRTGSELFKV